MQKVFGFALLFALAALAQSNNPLQVTVDPVGTPPQGLLISVHNGSQSPIRGYVLDVQFTDTATGKSLGHFTRTVMKPSLAGQPQYLNPGETATGGKSVPVVKNPSGGVAHYDVVVDSVVFADGSRWGPAKLSASQKLLGMIKGVDRVAK